MVLGVCRRVLRDRHDAEDAFQATFLVLIRKAGSLREGGVLANWLYGVAYRTALKARAAARRRCAFEKQVETTPERAASAASDNSELLSVLDAELSRLPDRYRLSVVLCDLQGLTRVEAAHRLGCPEGTLSTWLLRARDLLAQRLTRRGITLSVAALALAVEQSARAAVEEPVLSATVQTVTGGAPLTAAPQVGVLASSVIRSMFLAKLRVVAAIVLVVGALAGAAWFGASAPFGNARAHEDPTAPPQPAAKIEPITPKERTRFKGESLAAITADGNILATANFGDAITLWDLTRDQELGKLTLKEADARVLAFSPDGKLLACGGDKDVIHLWDVPNRKLLAVFKDKRATDSWMMSLAFSPDSKTLAAGSDLDTIKLFDVVGKKQSGTLPFEFSVNAVAFSPDGKTLAAGSATSAAKDGMVALFDVAQGKELARLNEPSGDVKALAFSRDGKTLVTGNRDSKIRLWDVERRKIEKTLEGHTSGIASVVITRDGKTVISGSRDKTVRLWDTATGKEITKLVAHTGGIITISISSDGSRFATAGSDRKVVLWELPSNAAPGPKAPAIPAAIEVPEGCVPLHTMEAEGVQIYVSVPDGAGFKWTFRAPLADLKVSGKVEGYHYAGPAWELKGGCKVVRDDAEPVRSTDSPDGKGNIPWLLIKLKADDTNVGRLAGAVYVQRINTEGGVPPAELPKRAGTEVGVKYRATYQFFRKK
jgi:RNA polymerase sigma factor (sigma-70 family)